MARLIYADDVTANIWERYDTAFMQSKTRPNKAWWEGYSAGVNWARNTINDVPTVDAVPVVHGRWIDSYIVKKLQYDKYPTVKCSKCGCYFCDVINNHHFMYHYCPHCGARMDLKEVE